MAIVGAGAKAAAIAAKANILNKVARSDIQVTVFEQQAVGANWSGLNGYTDGEARLCTAAERDLGFPYTPTFSAEVAQAMYRDYSWPSYLVAAGGSRGFANWVNRGRKPPTHAEYASYLQWAMLRSGVNPVIGRVHRAEPAEDGWMLYSRSTKGGRQSDGPFDGIVFTGPGPATSKVARVGASPKITDGRKFWLGTNRFIGRRKKSEEPVVIVGAGGTSAAIAARVLRDPRVDRVVIIGDQAVLFTRTETFFENQIFTDDELWENLSPKTRRDFTDRLNRGVVWSTISDELSKSGKLHFEPGRGKRIEVRRGIAGEELIVHYERNGKMLGVEASLVIDASGFDPWWFLSVLPTKYRAPLMHLDPERQRELRLEAMSRMDGNLVLLKDLAGSIHAPMVSQVAGPGFASLMVLGSMSDRILAPYKGP